MLSSPDITKGTSNVTIKHIAQKTTEKPLGKRAKSTSIDDNLAVLSPKTGCFSWFCRY
jgi:hypothetical protein